MSVPATMRHLGGVLRVAGVGLALLTAAALATPSPARADEVRVGVAANFTAATRRLAAAFQRATGNIVVATYASTGTLYAQIRHGAPYDVFLAADIRRPRLLERAGLTVPGSRFTYAVGRLALWSATPGLVQGSGDVLRGRAVRTVAIANPRTAPYGAAAKQVLEHMGLWESLQGRIVQGENIAQTYQYVASGNATLGFVALSELKARHPHADAWLPPADWYAPIEQQAVLLKQAVDKPAAKAWLAFLRGDQARAVIEALGYRTVTTAAAGARAGGARAITR